MKYAYKIFHDASVGASKHAIFFIDLDNFKNINDTLGHDYGDLLLKDVSDRMLSCIASDDILARNGGDEFLILKIALIPWMIWKLCKPACQCRTSSIHLKR